MQWCGCGSRACSWTARHGWSSRLLLGRRGALMKREWSWRWSFYAAGCHHVVLAGSCQLIDRVESNLRPASERCDEAHFASGSYHPLNSIHQINSTLSVKRITPGECLTFCGPASFKKQCRNFGYSPLASGTHYCFFFSIQNLSLEARISRTWTSQSVLCTRI